jgi:hypothetical protein
MKRFIILSVIIIVVLVIGVIAMVVYSDLSRLRYVRYVAKDNLIDLTFEYPDIWAVFERRGSYGSFIQAQILEALTPEQKVNKPQACSMVITIYPAEKAEFSPKTTQGLAEDIRKKRLALKGSKLLSSSKINIVSIDATDDKFSYEIFKIPLQAHTKPIPIVERVICFQNGSNFYVVRMEEGAETFDEYDEIFERILKSIQFKE